MTSYIKPALNSAQHVAQWQQRGLDVSDVARTEHYVSAIGYYRLSAYTLPFQLGNPAHDFQPGTTFDQVLDLYVFDRQLRLLVMDAIERIEVAVRSQLNGHMAQSYGPHWYLDEQYFDSKYDHKSLLANIERECRRSKEAFVKHYKAKYTTPRLPPTWAVTELLTYGQLSKIFDNLAASADRKAIARPFGVDAQVLRSWLQTVAYVRNLCAHHSRLWNRELGNAPALPKRPKTGWVASPIVLSDPNVKPEKRLYIALAVIEVLLQTANPESTWHWRLKQLLDRYPAVSRAHMGMPVDWDTDPFWKLTGDPPEEHS
jgi:abortive infection bacteriophage resistance protein